MIVFKTLKSRKRFEKVLLKFRKKSPPAERVDVDCYEIFENTLLLSLIAFQKFLGKAQNFLTVFLLACF